MKTYINSQEQHNKFWQYEIVGNKVVCTWGRVGTPGTSKSFSFSNQRQVNDFIDKKVYEKEKKGYAEVTSEKLQQESDLSQDLGIQNKINRILYVSKWGNRLTFLDNYSPDKYVYVEVLNSWKKTMTRLLLSKDESFKVEGQITEYDRKIEFDELRAVNGDADFVNAVRRQLRRMSEIVSQIMKTISVAAIGARKLFGNDDEDLNLPETPSFDDEILNVNTAGFDRSAIMSLAAMGTRSLEL